jgi:hypothetical protein
MVCAMIDEYIKNRYSPQVEWYDKKSVYYKRLTTILQILVIAPATIVPIAALLDNKPLTISLSLVVAIITAALKYFNLEELWHNYRTTCEKLRREKHLYDFRIDDYENAAEPEKIFVKKIESVLSHEHKEWAVREKEKQK